MPRGETAAPEVRLRQAVEAARVVADRAAHRRREIAAELERAVQRMGIRAPAARRVEDALSAGLGHVTETVSRPPLKWVRSGEGHVLAAAEALADALSGLAAAGAGVSEAAVEQLHKRQDLRASFRRLPDLTRAAEQSRSRLCRAFQSRAVEAMTGRLTTSRRVLERLAMGRAALAELAGELKSLVAPLDGVSAELGFFTGRGRAVAVPAAGGRREDVEIQVDRDGELLLSWDRYGASRLTVYPAREIAWRDGKANWRLCFSLPARDHDGRRLRVERPALATWTGVERARLVRPGVLTWAEHADQGFPGGARKPGPRQAG